ALVFPSIVSDVALEKVRKAETSTITVRGSPPPLLSVAAHTARSATMTTTDPSRFFVARISALVASVTLNWLHASFSSVVVTDIDFREDPRPVMAVRDVPGGLKLIVQMLPAAPSTSGDNYGHMADAVLVCDPDGQIIGGTGLTIRPLDYPEHALSVQDCDDHVNEVLLIRLGIEI